MAKQQSKPQPKAAPKPKADERLVDKYFRELPQAYPTAVDRGVLLISALLILLGFTGLFWALPFPYLSFLGKNNGFINWASFLMALAGYFYYRLSPVLCYLVIFILFVFAYLITRLLVWQNAGGPSLMVISDLEIVLGAIGFYGVSLRNRRTTQWEALNLLFISVAWYLGKLLKKIGARY
ncbi:hypothetical protein C8P68_105227 [Mucilaginibacter yixingensis]|uniref:Uncharacterized protein n=1 Tax=Mucilaginibacter yixingensis TaxID=1295612 RepID=A0A2T5J8K1_9SPHI|nr:hypothetical protein [Mucilaginibacter yixingensis]PTQ95719.1 hypothetical protein C8P68_105227 [Mucilaginibacter yixingensis]